MKIITPIAAISAVAFSLMAPSVRAVDYSTGVIVLNENQYGMADSSMNHLSLDPDGAGEWNYGIFDQANPGMKLGNTPASGGYAGDRLMVVCKQADMAGGTAESGGIVSCMDAATMKCLWQMPTLGPADMKAAGRGILPLSDKKVYVSSSNGIWVVETSGTAEAKMIEGTENPYGVDDKPVTDPTSSLYIGQCGTMVTAGGKVFAAHQEYGVLVIDPTTDRLEKTISLSPLAEECGIGSIVAGSDGALWISISSSKDGMGYTLPMLGHLDPLTLELTKTDLPAGMYGPSTSWAAWNPDTFCGSPDGYLYWTGGEDNWFANRLVYRFNEATRTTELLIDFDEDPDNWIVNTPSMRVDPATGNLWMTLFKDFASTEYTLRSYSASGVKLKDYPMKRSYWFCGTILFPESAIAGVESVASDRRDGAEISASYLGGKLSISCPSYTGEVAVYDMQGRCVATLQMTDGEATADVALAAGVHAAVVPGGAVKFAVR